MTSLLSFYDDLDDDEWYFEIAWQAISVHQNTCTIQCIQLLKKCFHMTALHKQVTALNSILSMCYLVHPHQVTSDIMSFIQSTCQLCARENATELIPQCAKVQLLGYCLLGKIDEALEMIPDIKGLDIEAQLLMFDHALPLSSPIHSRSW